MTTVKLVVLYTQPDDADAFDEHYLGVHAPLASDESRATAGDYQQIAPPGSRRFVAAVRG